MFVATGGNASQTALQNLMDKCIFWLNASKNEIILSLSNVTLSTPRYQSKLWGHWLVFYLHLKHIDNYVICNIIRKMWITKPHENSSKHTFNTDFLLKILFSIY